MSVWSSWDGAIFALAQQMRFAALEPSLALLSTLASFPFAIYCIRFIGEAALRIRRNERGVLVAVRLDERWASLLFRFVIASITAAGFVWILDFLFHIPTPSELPEAISEHALGTTPQSDFASGDGVFVAVLVGSLWGYATSCTSRALLLAYMACIGVALVISGAHSPTVMLGTYAVGFGAVGVTTHLLRPRN